MTRARVLILSGLFALFCLEQIVLVTVLGWRATLASLVLAICGGILFEAGLRLWQRWLRRRR